MESKALVLIDFENEWINPESEDYVGDIKEVIERTNKLIDFCRKNGYKIIFTRHVESDSKDGEAWFESSEGTKIIKEINREDSDVLITKYKISPFYKTNMDEELEGIKKVIVAGILTNLCVRSFIQDAYDRGFELVVIKNCCVTYNKETQEFTFKDLKETRPEVNFENSEDFINS